MTGLIAQQVSITLRSRRSSSAEDITKMAIDAHRK